MLKLTETEIKVADHFHIIPNNFNGEGELPSPREVLNWCIAEGLLGKKAAISEGERILKSLEKKFWKNFEDDSITLEDTATWVLSHYFTEEQLKEMQPAEAEKFLRNWKYFFGYRKCDGWGELYINNALNAIQGYLVLDPNDPEYFYRVRDELQE